MGRAEWEEREQTTARQQPPSLSAHAFQVQGYGSLGQNLITFLDQNHNQNKT